MSFLCEQNWDAMERSYVQTEPFNYAVIDSLLPDDVFAGVRAELVNSWAWQLMKQDGDELFIRDFGSDRIQAIGDQLVNRLPHVLGGLSLQQYVAFWHPRNAGFHAHSDIGWVSVNLWLTPDEYNLNPATGGLILHDVKRTEDMEILEFNSPPWSNDYLASHTKGAVVRVGYRCNRAVLFDGRTFHGTDTPLQFVNDGPESRRLNLTLMFDEPAQFHARLARHYARGGLGDHSLA